MLTVGTDSTGQRGASVHGETIRDVVIHLVILIKVASSF